MEEILYQTLLYDFYCELLTDKQKQMFEMYHLEDYSLQEISEHFNISRQGVRDSIKRTEKNLADYENKLNLVHKHTERKCKIEEVQNNILKLIKNNDLMDIDMKLSCEFDKLK